MTYSKPEISVLGSAVKAIQAQKNDPNGIEKPFDELVAGAYETEE
jgi:hypothetical protein